MDFKVITSQNIYQGKAVKLWLERVKYPDGREVSLEVIHHPGAVTILPVDADGQVWFVRQYRHPVGGMFLELPAGTLEKGEAPEETAAREIREEIGMAAGQIIKLGSFYMAPGYSDEFMHVYLATHLTPAPLAQDEGEFIEVEKYPLETVYKMLTDGTIQDGKTIAAFALAKNHLKG
ncbi:NUDIX hydrolase [bacterium]|nr:NUDIX hydrolase [bacterium]